MIRLHVKDRPLGYQCYVAHVDFDGVTVREVLEEIREYARNSKYAGYMGKRGDNFGNPQAEFQNRWDITIRDPNIRRFRYIITGSVSIWDELEERYDHQWDERRVKNVSAGDYCEGRWWSFNIELEE